MHIYTYTHTRAYISILSLVKMFESVLERRERIGGDRRTWHAVAGVSMIVIVTALRLI